MRRARDVLSLSLYCVPTVGWLVLSFHGAIVVVQVVTGAAGGWPVTAEFPHGLFWGLATQVLGVPWSGSTLSEHQPSTGLQALFAAGPTINLLIHAGVWVLVGHLRSRPVPA